MDTDRDRQRQQGMAGQGQGQEWRGQEWRGQGQPWNQGWNQGYGQYGAYGGAGNYTVGEGPYGNYGPGYYGYGQGYGYQGGNQQWNQPWNQGYGWRGQGHGQGQGQGQGSGEGVWGRSAYTPIMYRNQYPYNRPWQERGPFSGVGPQGYQRSDHRIQEDINDQLTEHPHLDASNINVQVHNGEVTLTGNVNSRQDKRTAEDIADSVPGVRDVHNNLKVEQNQSLLGKIENALTPGNQSSQQNQPTGQRR